MLVREAMSANVRVVNADTTVQEVAKIMKNEKIGSVIVTKENDEVLGMVTEGTIIREIVAHGKSLETKVREIMITNPHVINPDRTLEEAADLMRRKHVKRLPVVENDAIIGMITTTDLIAYEDKRVEKLAEMFVKDRMEAQKPKGEVEMDDEDY